MQTVDISTVCTRLTVLFPLIAGYLCNTVYAKEATIRIDTQMISEWSVDRMLFGRFFEHHDQDVYPGTYEQYIINSSFAEWYRKDENSLTPVKDVREWLVFTDITETQGVAYPWEPFGCEHGPSFELSPVRFNSETSQQIKNSVGTSDAHVGVKQRIGLADYRTDRYKLEFYAKAHEDVNEVTVMLKDYQSGEIVDTKRFRPTSHWQSFKGTLDINGKDASLRHRDRRGVFEIVFCFTGNGSVFLDQVTLFPSDAVNGRWNPETIANFKNAGITSIRWPGGNFASGYYWQDGIGPIEKRPTRPNLAWGGLEPNHVGTDEFLEFCEIAGLTPIICVGFDYVPVHEAANWVEYVNGCPESTHYGALRAANGRYRPYNIEIWQVGNEVYGAYQIGHTNAEDYAIRYLDYYIAMKRADPTIKVMSMGRDPGYHTNDDNAWNKTLFEIIGDKMDYMDIHRYIRGIRNRAHLGRWVLIHLSEIYISYPTQYETVVIDSIRQLTKPQYYNLPDVKLAVTEWAQYLSLEADGVPHRWSHGNAVFYAGMMNVFLRNSDFVRISCSHDFSVIIHNHRYVPPSPRNLISRLYSEAAAGLYLLKSEVFCDTFDMAQSIPQMETIQNIPFVDAVALIDKDKTQIVVFLLNRSLTSAYDTTIEFQTQSSIVSAEYTQLTAKDNPLSAQRWENPDVVNIRKGVIQGGNDKLALSLPVCSVTRLKVFLK